MTREEKEKFCKDSADFFEHHTHVKWDEMEETELEKFAEWFDYLWDK